MWDKKWCLDYRRPYYYLQLSLRRLWWGEAWLFFQVTAITWEGTVSSCTRGRFRLHIRANFFSKRVTKHWNRLHREAEESPSLEAFRKCVVWYWGMWFSGNIGGRWTVGLNDLGGLFWRLWFYGSILVERGWSESPKYCLSQQRGCRRQLSPEAMHVLG